MHSEFERTPKAGAAEAQVSAPVKKSSHAVKVHWPYVLTEAFFVLHQLGWAVVLATRGFVLCTIGAVYVASCVVYLAFFYGDHAGKVCFRLRQAPAEDPGRGQEPVAGTLAGE